MLSCLVLKSLRALTESDVEAFRLVVDGAKDEVPIQRFLETNPHVLGALLPGRSRFVIARPRLAEELVPDFLLADVDSTGLRWILLELETPNSAVTLAKSKEFDRFARKGVGQIREWREWIQENLDRARRPISEGGNGLFDIRPQSVGLVIVGRREHLHRNASQLRRALEETAGIAVHTYDWLLERLDRTRRYSGLPVLNPDALQRVGEDDNFF